MPIMRFISCWICAVQPHLLFSPSLLALLLLVNLVGNPYLGATLGGILTHPALTNARGVAAGFQTMNFFGFEIAMIGYQNDFPRASGSMVYEHSGKTVTQVYP